MVLAVRMFFIVKHGQALRSSGASAMLLFDTNAASA
jgi:hypothetical protein